MVFSASLSVRLDRVPDSARSLLALAAVIGRQIDTTLLAEYDSQTDLEDWFTTCSNLAVLEIHDEHWRFAHDKLRDGLLEKLEKEQRAKLHEYAAKAIEIVYPDAPEQFSALAYHWGMAKNPEKELRYATLAGRQALQTSAFAEARQFLTRSLELESKPDQQAMLRYEIGEVFRGLSQYEDAMGYYRQALGESLDYPGSKLALLGLGRASLDQGNHSEAISHLEQALTRFGSGDDPVNQSYTLYGLSRAYRYAGEIGESPISSRNRRLSLHEPPTISGLRVWHCSH